MKTKKTLTLFVLGALAMSLMTGCGANSNNQIDPNDPGYGYDDPGYNNPGTDPGYNNPGYNNPGYNNPGYNNPGTTLPVQLSATVTKKETSGILFWKKIKTVTVQVSNPSQQMVQGTLKVNFSKDGQSAGTVEQSISLAPGGTQEYSVTPTTKADDATAYAEVLQNGSTPGYGTNPGTGSGWGTGTGSGSTWGTGSGTGTGTGTGWGTSY